jgi:hypothetical protein
VTSDEPGSRWVQRMLSVDRVRQVLTVAAALAQVVLPATLARSFRRDLRPPNVVQPADTTFVVWLPIFAGGLGYAAYQARRGADRDPVLRAVGWPLAAAFASTGVWAPLVRARRYWAAQAALAGISGFAEVARQRLAKLEHGQALSVGDKTLIAPVTGMTAAWGTVATGVNLAAMLIDARLVAGRLATPLGVATLLALGATVIGTTRPAGTRSIVNRAYLSTILWAFGGVFASQRKRSPMVSATALGVIATVAVAVLGRKSVA